MDIDHESPEPVYEQIARQIRGDIKSRVLRPGNRIPSIEQIRQDTGCAIITIRRGVQVLERDGFVVIVPGKGTFVNPPELWEAE